MEKKDSQMEIENEDKCDVNQCRCNAKYLLIGIAAIFLILFISTTIK
jgi:hypothetical protein